MVDQLNSFASEVTRVAREVGTEGKLGGQAEVKGVSGTWKDLTENVNFMASNLTSQVRSIAQVATAVAKIEYFGGTDGLLDFMARTSGRKQEPLHLALGYEQRLAIEMVAHEESERLAMEGELAELEAAWREAEEVSAIADNLLTPASILNRIRAAR
jgi:HAMP domain-containing protein